jgi:carbon storage regulator
VLVITRKLNQAVIIGEGIEIRVLRVGRDGVRIGVTAPPEIRVHRKEIYEVVGAANVSAATTPPARAERVAERLRTRLGTRLEAELR